MRDWIKHISTPFIPQSCPRPDYIHHSVGPATAWRDRRYNLCIALAALNNWQTQLYYPGSPLAKPGLTSEARTDRNVEMKDAYLTL